MSLAPETPSGKAGSGVCSRKQFIIARRFADQHGLFLLEQGKGPAVSWVIYSARSGRTLGTYHPRSRRWCPAGKQWRCADYLDALRDAAAAASLSNGRCCQ